MSLMYATASDAAHKKWQEKQSKGPSGIRGSKIEPPEEDSEGEEERRKAFEHFKLFCVTDFELPGSGSHVSDEEAEKLGSSFTSGWSWIPLDDESNKSLYFLVSKYDCYRSFDFKWYTLDCNEEGNPFPECCTTLSPVISAMPPAVPNFFSTVAFGSRIYLIGGLTTFGAIFHASVFYYDTAHPHQGWKEGPSMIAARAHPSVVVALGKIYVFGGLNSQIGYKKSSYAEVLDPTLDRWEELPEPPQDLSDLSDFFVEPVHALLSDDRGNRHILIHPRHTTDIVSYNIDTGTWDMFGESFGDNWSGTGVAVNGVLYCCVGCNVYACDLLKRKLFTSPVRGFEDCKDSFQPPDDENYPSTTYLIHIGGGKLCLFWFSMIHVTVICTIFTVQRHEPLSGGGEPYFVAHVESVKRHYVDGDDGEVENCFAL